MPFRIALLAQRRCARPIRLSSNSEELNMWVHHPNIEGWDWNWQKPERSKGLTSTTLTRSAEETRCLCCRAVVNVREVIVVGIIYVVDS
jgi:hypothetical protein